MADDIRYPNPRSVDSHELTPPPPPKTEPLSIPMDRAGSDFGSPAWLAGEPEREEVLEFEETGLEEPQEPLEELAELSLKAVATPIVQAANEVADEEMAVETGVAFEETEEPEAPIEELSLALEIEGGMRGATAEAATGYGFTANLEKSEEPLEVADLHEEPEAVTGVKEPQEPTEIALTEGIPILALPDDFEGLARVESNGQTTKTSVSRPMEPQEQLSEEKMDPSQEELNPVGSEKPLASPEEEIQAEDYPAQSFDAPQSQSPKIEHPEPAGEELRWMVERFKRRYVRRMNLTVGRDMAVASKRDQFDALAYTIRDEMIDRWIKTQSHYYDTNPKRVYYLSLEFLMGRTMGNALLNLGMTEAARLALEELGTSLDLVEDLEKDAGLGNGGLGRLAACFLDSMATMELPAYGYGIRYEYGMFNQTIENLQQREHPDNWLHDGTPWEIARPEASHEVHFGGRVTGFRNVKDQHRDIWEEGERVNAVAYDVPIPGYRTNNVNTLKLWRASSTESFNLATFNEGNYIEAIVDKHQSEVISKVLYPNDKSYQGKELRLKQQYFMVSASLQDIIERLEKCGDTVHNLPNKVAIQLNDTHPSIAIAEMMRLLLDKYNFEWDDAWEVTTNTFAYTNHTVLPEALETWPVDLLGQILPRHIQIIYEINQRFLDQVAAYFPGDFDRRARMSIVGDGQVRMAHLAIVGSYSVNGVAELHSRLLTAGIFRDFFELYPGKFNNKTNGITPRRWLKHCNPELSQLITSKIGDHWVKHLDELKRLEAFAEDTGFQDSWRKVKRKNKIQLANLIHSICHVQVEVDSLFDVQVKRIHEYKRQLLNILHVILLYNRIKDGDLEGFVPRTVIFGGKAAPGYQRAKEIIHLINGVANLVNRDRRVGRLLRVVFLPNYGVSLAEKIFPGSDLSEQISTAGMEASGTGNMKFALNGSLTIGTLDGANIEIMEEVGRENIFICGKTEEEIRQIRSQGYNPQAYIAQDWELKRVLEQVRDGYFSPNQPDQFVGIYDTLVNHGDHFMVLADFRSYVDCQSQVAEAYRDQKQWTKMSILNVARMGKFSSDRVIDQYAKEIWGVEPSPVP